MPSSSASASSTLIRPAAGVHAEPDLNSEQQDQVLFGEVFEVRMRELRFARRFDWQTLSRFGGGLINNAGSHYLDLGMQLLGAPRRLPSLAGGFGLEVAGYITKD